MPGWAYLLAWLLALGNAASSSRTGLLQWMLIAAAHRLVGAAGRGGGCWCLRCRPLLAYGVAVLTLPWLLELATGLHSGGLFGRLAEAPGCSSRKMLWSNVLTLIAQKPWLGWGWGELDYAHFITCTPGRAFAKSWTTRTTCRCIWRWSWAFRPPWRFAAAWAGGVARPALARNRSGAADGLGRAGGHRAAQPAGISAVVRAVPDRRRAVSVAAVSGAGAGRPAGSGFQQKIKQNRPVAQYLTGACSYHYDSDSGECGRQLSPRQPDLPAARQAQRRPTATTRWAKSAAAWFFHQQARFAELSMTPLTPGNARAVHAMALELLHYSPEPRVIEKVIESAVMLGRDDEALQYLVRYRAAFPQEHARWAQQARWPAD